MLFALHPLNVIIFPPDRDKETHQNWKHRKRPTKFCIKSNKIFEQFPQIIQGHFVEGKLSGEAKILFDKTKEVVYVNFVDGIAHGTVR